MLANLYPDSRSHIFPLRKFLEGIENPHDRISHGWVVGKSVWVLVKPRIATDRAILGELTKRPIEWQGLFRAALAAFELSRNDVRQLD